MQSHIYNQKKMVTNKKKIQEEIDLIKNSLRANKYLLSRDESLRGSIAVENDHLNLGLIKLESELDASTKKKK